MVMEEMYVNPIKVSRYTYYFFLKPVNLRVVIIDELHRYMELQYEHSVL